MEDELIVNILQSCDTFSADNGAEEITCDKDKAILCVASDCQGQKESMKAHE